MTQPAIPSEVRVVNPQGHVRMGDAVDQLRTLLDENLNSGYPRIVVNMAGVKSLDSSAIGVLVRSLSLSKQRGGSIKLSRVPETALQTLQVTGVLKLFEVFAEDSLAIGSFGGK